MAASKIMPPSGRTERPLDDVELVVNLADHLFENVLERDQAENAAEFVDDHGEADAARAKFKKQLAGRLRFRHDQDLAQRDFSDEMTRRAIALRRGRARSSSSQITSLM